MRRLGAWMILALAGGCGEGPAARGTAAPTEEVDAILARRVQSDECRAQLREEFVGGARTERRGCARERDEVARRLHRRGRSFGVVEQRAVDLRGLSLTLSVASACRAWPLRRRGEAVLGPAAAERAGCERRSFEGWLAVDVVDATGVLRPDMFELEVRGGRAHLDFATADALLRELEVGGLDRVARFELDWAGAVDVQRLLAYRADWHFEWVSRGWGSPALFEAAHERHPRSGDARALAVEHTLDRQQRDYQAVASGQLPPEVFLRRHVWSPYRASVQHMAAAVYEGRAPTPATAEP